MNVTQRLLTSTRTIATTLLALVIDRFDTDGLYWEPEILNEELEKLAGDRIPPINMDKIQALTSALTSDQFFDDIYVFSTVCNAIGGLDEEIVFNTFDPPMPKELAWGVYEVVMNNPAKEPEKLFSSDVLKYMGLLLLYGGISEAPRSLNFVSVPLESSPDVFADDPALYSAFNTLLQENKGSIDNYVSARVDQLMAELSSIPFEEGSMDKIKEVLSKRK